MVIICDNSKFNFNYYFLNCTAGIHLALLLGHIQLHRLLLVLLIKHEDRLVQLLLELLRRDRDIPITLRRQHSDLRVVLVLQHVALQFGLVGQNTGGVGLLLSDHSLVHERVRAIPTVRATHLRRIAAVAAIPANRGHRAVAAIPSTERRLRRVGGHRGNVAHNDEVNKKRKAKYNLRHHKEKHQ